VEKRGGARGRVGGPGLHVQKEGGAVAYYNERGGEGVTERWRMRDIEKERGREGGGTQEGVAPWWLGQGGPAAVPGRTRRMVGCRVLSPGSGGTGGEGEGSEDGVVKMMKMMLKVL